MNASTIGFPLRINRFYPSSGLSQRKDTPRWSTCAPSVNPPTSPATLRKKRAAEAAGLRYFHVPVTLSSLSMADVLAFREATGPTQGRVLAHCKTGGRALALHALSTALDAEQQPEEVARFGSTLGFDLTAAANWLRRERGRRPRVAAFYEPKSGSLQYVVSDPKTRRSAIVDPVLDFDPHSGATATRQADAILAYVRAENLTVEWILDTHPHADHFSAVHYLKQKTGALTAIGAHVVDVQRIWREVYNAPAGSLDGSYWDRTFADGDVFRVGDIEARVMHSPGHTLASVTYLVGDAAFVHDTLFMPDSGTARADFPGGDAKALWTSIQSILALPDETRLFTGHDYRPGGRHPRWESTVGEQKRANPHILGQTAEAFVKTREARDRTLPMPDLMLHALQVNARGGRLPEPEANGRRYLKFPLDAFPGAAW